MAWDYDKIQYQKQATDEKWRLERLINYGLAEEKIDKKILEKYIAELNIPENRRIFLELLLWNRKF